MDTVKWSLAFAYLIQEIVALQCPRTNSSTATCPTSCCDSSFCCAGECCDSVCCAQYEIKEILMRYYYVFPIFVVVCATIVIIWNHRDACRRETSRVRPKVSKPRRIMVKERSSQSITKTSSKIPEHSSADLPGAVPEPTRLLEP